jgi:hypothetical protein
MCLHALFLCVVLGDIGEHQCTAALARLELLRACLLKQRLWFRPVRPLVKLLFFSPVYAVAERLTSSWRAWS